MREHRARGGGGGGGVEGEGRERINEFQIEAPREYLIFVEAAAREGDGYPPGEHAHLMPSGTNGVSIAHCQWRRMPMAYDGRNVRCVPRCAGAGRHVYYCRLKFA